MNRIVLFCLLCLSLAGIWIACKRVDDEPQYPVAAISRLYISFSDVANSDTEAFRNVVVFDPADSANYFPPGNGYETTPNQGMGITFSPHLRQAFQVSRANYMINFLTVSETGAVSRSSRSFVDSVRARSFRSIRYDRPTDKLFLTNDDPATPAEASLNIYNNPARLVGQQRPRKKLRLASRPWGLATGMTMESGNASDSLILLSMLQNTKEIWAFNIKNIAEGDSTSNGTPNYRLAIEGASDLRGIAYAPNADILFVTDLGESTGSTVDDGKIYVIENAKEVMRTGGSIRPSRIITGPNTTLKDPIDIAVSDAPNRNQFLYVADRAARTVMRFNLDASGNVAPNENSLTQLTLTPEFIYLDAR